MLDSLVWASENLLLCVAREKDADGAEPGKTGGRSTKGNADGAAMVLSAEALRRVEAQDRRIEAVKGRRKGEG